MVKALKHALQVVAWGNSIVSPEEKEVQERPYHSLQLPERRLYWFILVPSKELKTHQCFGHCWAGPPQHLCNPLSTAG